MSKESEVNRHQTSKAINQLPEPITYVIMSCYFAIAAYY